MQPIKLFFDARYEPVGIESELHIADYYKYANESKAATKDYLKSSLNI
jgi:hypothetical protein